jgi:hypothetical protein
MLLQNLLRKFSHTCIICCGLLITLFSPISYADHYHGHAHGHVDRGYHGHGGYYRENHGHWGGYYGGPWFGPAVVIAVPYGRRYYEEAYPCSVVERCYPNGDCFETEIC